MEDWTLLQTEETLEPPIHVTRLAGRTPVTRYPDGRHCTTCNRTLSIYNPGPGCCHHTPLRYPTWKASRRF